MKTLLTAAAVALLLAAPLQAETQGHGEHHFALQDVQWEDAPIPGVQLAHAWGEDATGAAWLIRIAPGVALPMHTHTHDYRGLSIAGTWVHIEADGTEVATVSGDHSLIEGGAIHADRCDGEVSCIGLLVFSGPRDVALAQ